MTEDFDFKSYGIEMWEEAKITAFRKALLAWYDKEKRDLPWRRTSDPYAIWVSEIMLQQTQVVTVIPYYERFLSWFPSISDLAQAPEEKLLKAWEGLGYYSRVRNMQTAAHQVMADFKGQFPTSHEGISSLKGIGPYTAGAIASIAFGLPQPAVDGNVMRVMARLFEVDYDIGEPKNRKIFQAIMEVLIDPQRPGDFNQALMDLGTDIEAAKNPRPEESPVKDFNAAYLHGTYDRYPIKKPKKKPRPIHLQAFIIQNSKGEFLLEKNTEEGLLSGFWSFPLIETNLISQQLELFGQDNQVMEAISQKDRFAEDYQLSLAWTDASFPTVSHTFSHQKWQIQLLEGFVENAELTSQRELRWVPAQDLSYYPLAAPQKKMMAAYSKRES